MWRERKKSENLGGPAEGFLAGRFGWRAGPGGGGEPQNRGTHPTKCKNTFDQTTPKCKCWPNVAWPNAVKTLKHHF